jgi:hypothetical protein
MLKDAIMQALSLLTPPPLPCWLPPNSSQKTPQYNSKAGTKREGLHQSHWQKDKDFLSRLPLRSHWSAAATPADSKAGVASAYLDTLPPQHNCIPCDGVVWEVQREWASVRRLAQRGRGATEDVVLGRKKGTFMGREVQCCPTLHPCHYS